MQSQLFFCVLEDSHDGRSGDGDLLQLNSNRYPRTTHEAFTRVYGIELPRHIPMLFWEFEKEKRTPFPVSGVKRWGAGLSGDRAKGGTPERFGPGALVHG